MAEHVAAAAASVLLWGGGAGRSTLRLAGFLRANSFARSASISAVAE